MESEELEKYTPGRYDRRASEFGEHLERLRVAGHGEDSRHPHEVFDLIDRRPSRDPFINRFLEYYCPLEPGQSMGKIERRICAIESFMEDVDELLSEKKSVE
jgi:hypothetical protein